MRTRDVRVLVERTGRRPATELGHERLHAGGPCRDQRIAVAPKHPRGQPPCPALLVVAGARQIIEGPRPARQDGVCGDTWVHGVKQEARALARPSVFKGIMLMQLDP